MRLHELSLCNENKGGRGVNKSLRRLLRSFSFPVERCISFFLDSFSFQVQLVNW